MFHRRRSRISIGVLCQLDYKKAKLEGMRTSEIQHLAKKRNKVSYDQDGRRWIDGCIEWFVKWVSDPEQRRSRRQRRAYVTDWSHAELADSRGRHGVNRVQRPVQQEH